MRCLLGHTEFNCLFELTQLSECRVGRSTIKTSSDGILIAEVIFFGVTEEYKPSYTLTTPFSQLTVDTTHQWLFLTLII